MWMRTRTEWNLHWPLTKSSFDAVGDLQERLALLTLGLHIQAQDLEKLKEDMVKAEGAAGLAACSCQQGELTDQRQDVRAPWCVQHQTLELKSVAAASLLPSKSHVQCLL